MLERFPKRWDAPKGYPILGESSTGLAQGGQSADTDDMGRIYFTIVPDGAGMVRFNPHTGKFEQPPVNFHAELLKFIPPEEFRQHRHLAVPAIPDHHARRWCHPDLPHCRLRTSTDEPIQLLEFKRPTATIWTTPNGQIFFLTALDGTESKSVIGGSQDNGGQPTVRVITDFVPPRSP